MHMPLILIRVIECDDISLCIAQALLSVPDSDFLLTKPHSTSRSCLYTSLSGAFSLSWVSPKLLCFSRPHVWRKQNAGCGV